MARVGRAARRLSSGSASARPRGARMHRRRRSGTALAARQPLSHPPMAPQQGGIRVSEALSGESTQASGSDASNDAPMAPQATHTPARPAQDPQADAEHTVMERGEGACGEQEPARTEAWAAAQHCLEALPTAAGPRAGPGRRAGASKA